MVMFFRSQRSLLVAFLIAFVSGCAGLNDPYDPYYGGGGSGGGYGGGYGNRQPPPPSNSGGYYGNGYNNGYNYGDGYDRRERERLEEERRRLERERERLEQERNRQDVYRPPPPPLRPAPDRCPRGFSPSENKCSTEERRRGCKDIRMPSGLGCVHR
jgi:hypothetical protein